MYANTNANRNTNRARARAREGREGERLVVNAEWKRMTQIIGIIIIVIKLKCYNGHLLLMLFSSLCTHTHTHTISMCSRMQMHPKIFHLTLFRSSAAHIHFASPYILLHTPHILHLHIISCHNFFVPLKFSTFQLPSV